MLDLFELNCAPQYHWSDFIKFITNSRVVRNIHFELYSSNSYTSIFIRNIQSAITTNDGIDLFNKNFFYISGTLLTLSDFLDLHQNGFHNSDFGRKTEPASAKQEYMYIYINIGTLLYQIARHHKIFHTRHFSLQLGYCLQINIIYQYNETGLISIQW